ncbi:homoserine O-acetyltransferase [Suhomyces tanzawaensis NRRL Y-17324]|uniref:Homoserine O-acetyltransferase n=1 Tax=Suhomyces tanzawaensis NRRL Y-17324 TaxID=984487 RepID=A0A1E4SRP9_9ASCO|nr:homoserine O-acetyltransferase [Suhomyces tanzawaensis NRRL Y-17324]ODV82178.1 homoserine O-acetyltransferase [Suhomyces tanzawaensis NRRL Y-17324]
MTTTSTTYRDITAEQNETNPYARLVNGQTIVEIPSYTLECGETLYNFPVAYKTWGRLNDDRDNVLLICHALTGSSDVSDWWGPLLGTNKTFDPSRFFVVCINFLGSPYGSCSPVTIDPATGKPYGPSFPLVTVKDDIGIHKLILDSLNIASIACVIGGSMGGMIAMEYSTTYNNTNYVKSVVALATAARASAWCISWNETQRQCIFSDPFYDEGNYYETNNKPDSGLSAARMAALLTYRSRNSFETRFGRKLPFKTQTEESVKEAVRYPKTKDEENWLMHNEGLKNSGAVSSNSSSAKPQTYFTAQSYLRYQGNKFVNRFDANCYISISRKLDTHDITRNRVDPNKVTEDPLPHVLAQLSQPHLIIGIESDGLFTFGEQQLLGDKIPNSTLKKLDSPEGHDAFLLEFEVIDEYCREFLQLSLPEYYDDSGKVDVFENWEEFVKSLDNGGNSVFGEAETNITNW